MINIEVKGIPCQFNDGALDDFGMLRNLQKWESGEPTAMVNLAIGIFGEEQLSNIERSLADDSGVCHIRDMSAFMSEAMRAASEAKLVEQKN